MIRVMSFFLRKKIWVLFLILSVPVGTSAIEGIYQYGDRGPVIKLFQIILNFYPETKLANVGPGSPGQETDFFGSLTKTALIKFQKNQNITGENGYFGRITQQSILSKAQQLLEVLISINKEIEGKNSPISNNVRDNNTATTNNLTNSNQIIQTSTSLPSLPSSADSFADSPWAPKISQTMKITSLSPTFGPYGTTVTIGGYGFSTTKPNKVFTGYDTLDLVSIDGKTLQFSVNAFNSGFNEITQNIKSSQKSFVWPLAIYVKNDSGISNKVDFNLEFK